MRHTILLIEDEKIMRVTLEDALKAAGYNVSSFETGSAGLAAAEGDAVDIVVTDVRLPDMNGFEVVKLIVQRNIAPVIVMTAFGTIKDAVKAMKLGAFDYITKPFALDEFMLLVERALEVQRLKEENIRLRKDLGRCYCAPNIIGISPAMKHVFYLVEKVADTDSNILILGESGTGKELIATTIHYQGRRKSGPLIKVNCAALPEGLIESELFGHEKGAFTGALRRKPGRFELASGGTIFLDEVADIPPSTQVKLLRVIQERSFERVGGTETVNVDVRIIAATNKDLQAEVRDGRFREDLYYRLNVIPITLPPLRERREDIPGLIEHILGKCRERLSKDVKISREAVDILMGYDYPGNVRELENIIERAAILSSSGIIEKEDLPAALNKGHVQTAGLSLADVVAEAEKNHILRVLKSTEGNKTRAAELLGISRKTLWEKMNAYGI